MATEQEKTVGELEQKLIERAEARLKKDILEAMAPLRRFYNNSFGWGKTTLIGRNSDDWIGEEDKKVSTSWLLNDMEKSAFALERESYIKNEIESFLDATDNLQRQLDELRAEVGRVVDAEM